MLPLALRRGRAPGQRRGAARAPRPGSRWSWSTPRARATVRRSSGSRVRGRLRGAAGAHPAADAAHLLPRELARLPRRGPGRGREPGGGRRAPAQGHAGAQAGRDPQRARGGAGGRAGLRPRRWNGGRPGSAGSRAGAPSASWRGRRTRRWCSGRSVRRARRSGWCSRAWRTTGRSAALARAVPPPHEVICRSVRTPDVRPLYELLDLVVAALAERGTFPVAARGDGARQAGHRVRRRREPRPDPGRRRRPARPPARPAGLGRRHRAPACRSGARRRGSAPPPAAPPARPSPSSDTGRAHAGALPGRWPAGATIDRPPHPAARSLSPSGDHRRGVPCPGSPASPSSATRSSSTSRWRPASGRSCRSATRWW